MSQPLQSTSTGFHRQATRPVLLQHGRQTPCDMSPCPAKWLKDASSTRMSVAQVIWDYSGILQVWGCLIFTQSKQVMETICLLYFGGGRGERERRTFWHLLQHRRPHSGSICLQFLVRSKVDLLFQLPLLHLPGRPIGLHQAVDVSAVSLQADLKLPLGLFRELPVKTMKACQMLNIRAGGSTEVHFVRDT